MLSQDNPAGAAIILDEAFALAQEHGVRIFVSVTACYRGMAYLEQGRIEEARAILADAREDGKVGRLQIDRAARRDLSRAHAQPAR